MYAYCFKTECKWAEKCSHAIMYSQASKSDESLRAINPKAQTIAEDGKCQFFSEPTTITVAHGMLRSTGKMPYDTYRSFAAAMKEKFNKTDFYDMRSGKKDILPRHQKIILRIVEDLEYEFPGSPWDSTTEEVRYD